MKFCLVNGIQQNHITIENRGLAYGDGLFTTAKILNGNVQYLTAHIERLLSGCKKLGFTPPVRNELIKQLNAVAKNHALAVLKVIIIASNGGRGYARPVDHSHDLIIMVYDYPTSFNELANTGIKLGVSEQQLGLNPMLGGLKHLNRLEQVLLRQELSTRSEDDLLVTNINDEVIEATSANLFFFVDGKLFTPDVSQSGVDGIMRQTILQHYPTTIVKAVTLAELAKAQEIFLCNCVMGIMPVATFNNKALATKLVDTVSENMKQIT
ncbi:MAG: aminodeoxychorismate lyase [Colwellia sp.]|nr:aminodeoxychorismate lyase [Colwellia sp.]